MKTQVVKLHEGQYEVATDPHRFKVICAGRRWGKSVLSRLIMLKWALETPGDYWIVTPTYIQGKDIHWHQGFRRELNEKAVKKWNDSDLSIELMNGSRIQIKSAENPDRLVGVKLHGLIIDEIAKLRNWNWLWNEALRPTLTDYRAPALFISSPRGYNHFYDLFERGQKDDPVYKSWRFTSYDNRYVPKDEIDQAKTEMPIEKFSQEYLAEFTRFTGIIYREFEEEFHVGWFEHEFNKRGNYILGLDFATRGFVAAVVIFQDLDGKYYVLDCYKKENLTAKEHAQNITNMMATYTEITNYKGYADPAGWASNQQGIRNNKPMNWSLVEEYQEEGINVIQGNNKVLGGINYVRQLFKDNKILIHSKCQDLIDELHDYQWKEQPERLKTEHNEPEEPRKYNDHLCFTKDTIIKTPLSKKIAFIKTGKKEVYKFMGSKVTKDHPYLTTRGFVRLDSLRYSDKIVLWKKLLLMELPLDDIQNPRAVSLQTILYLLQRSVSAIKQNAYTGIYGKKKTVKFLKACTFTTLMAIQLIILWIISNLYHLDSTIKDITKRTYQFGESILKMLSKRHQNGVKQKKDTNLEKNLGKETQSIFQDMKLKESAMNVKKNILLKQSLENTVTKIAKLEPAGKEYVYSTTTTTGFFTANNVVVSNCDALRYALFSKETPLEVEAQRPLWNGGELITFKPWNYTGENKVDMYDDKFTKVN